MVNVIYNDNIPDGPNNPSQDQPKMQTNTNSLRSLIEIDHIGFGNNDGGYHNIVHQPSLGRTYNNISPTSFTPAVAPIAGVNQIIAADYTPDTSGGTVDTQLFSLTGVGGISQLTGNSFLSDGWVWAGGVLIQWGRVTYGILTNGVVTFKDRVEGAIPFPNSLFTVVATETYTGVQPASSKGVFVSNDPLNTDNTKFTWARVTGSGNNPNGFFWIAVGH